jgi:hypothetical protein
VTLLYEQGAFMAQYRRTSKYRFRVAMLSDKHTDVSV